MSHSGKIELFKEETIKFNKKHNLISKKNTEEIIDEGIAEAAALTKHIKQYKNILDIGTGSGLPGIPLAIFNENKNIYLSEKNNKKNYHIKKTIKTLEINNATTVGISNKNTNMQKKHHDEKHTYTHDKCSQNRRQMQSIQRTLQKIIKH